MTALTRWNPFKEMFELTEASPLAPLRELERMRNRMERLFGSWPAFPEKEALLPMEWAPRVDITETEKEFLIKAELTEVKKEEVKVTVENGVVLTFKSRFKDIIINTLNNCFNTSSSISHKHRKT